MIPATSAEWTAWLADVPHDFYHTAAYHRLAEQCGEGTAVLAVYGDRDRFVAWPHLVRDVSQCTGLESATCRDVASVYGYPGPLGWQCAGDAAFLAEAWDALRAWWVSQQVVTAFTRFHPLLANHALVPAEGPASSSPLSTIGLDSAGGVVASGHTVSIDLTLGDTANIRDYQKVMRQEIGRGRRMGLTTAVDQDWHHLEAFVDLYHQTMSRNHASTQYFFSADYFRRLRQALGPALVLMVTTLGDEVAAAGLFVEYQGFVQAHLAGSQDHLKALSPLKVLLDDVRRWSQERGNRAFHLGGGRAGRDDSLLAFKGRFSPVRHEFHVGGWVLDPAMYRRLCEERLAYAERAGMRVDGEDYFPRYRARLLPLEPPGDAAAGS